MLQDPSPVDIEIAAKTVLAEAGNQSYEGQVAVAFVIANRAKSSQWARVWTEEIATLIVSGDTPLKTAIDGKPGSYVAVCLQPWQFSCWNRSAGDTGQRVRIATWTPNTYATQTSLVLALPQLIDPVDGAQFYFADYIAPPDWAAAMTFVRKIGVHLFYREDA